GNVTLYPMNETKMTNVFEGVNSISANASQIKNTNIQASHRGIYFLPGVSTNLAFAPGFCYENNLINVTGNTNLSTGIELWYSGGKVPLFAVGNFNRTKIANSTILMNGRMGYGMLLNNVKRTILRTGLFTNQPIVNANTINLNAPSVSLGGINLTNSENTDATNNLIASTSNARAIVNTSASPVGLFPVGIYMNMSQDTLRCNSMMNLRTGMRFTGTCANTNMQRNKFYNHTSGLRLDNSSSLQSQINTGNTWLGTYCPPSQGYAAENAQPFLRTQFFYGSSSPAKYAPSLIKPSLLFRPNTRTDNDACTGAIGNGTSGSGSGAANWSGNGLNGIILQGGLAFESYETPLIYQNEAELYEELKPLEDILPDTSDELAFIHQLDTGSIGAFYQIEQKELSYGQHSSADSSLLVTAGYLRDSLERQLSYYDAIRASYEDTLVDFMPDSLRSTIDSSMALLLDQISPIRAQLDEYHSLAFTRLQLQCDTLLQMLSEVETIDTPSRLKKRFLNLYYRTIGRGQRQLDSFQIDSFRQLAQLCPLLEPDAVYRSRAIMRLYEDTIFYDDALICNASGMEYKSTKQPKAKPQITCILAPNPARDYTTLRFSALPKDQVTISIADIQGRTIYNKSMTLENMEYRLDTKDWNQGIYLVQVIQSNLVIFESKLQIKANE
ncbi:MAG: T9SS type A sorting domain-containing protein, partial [Chitinophagales bacterium]